MTRPDPNMQFVQVLRTTNQPLVATFRAALDAAGIPHFVRGEEAASLMPLNAVVVVPAEHAEAAKKIRDIEAPDDAGDDSDED